MAELPGFPDSFTFLYAGGHLSRAEVIDEFSVKIDTCWCLLVRIRNSMFHHHAMTCCIALNGHNDFQQLVVTQYLISKQLRCVNEFCDLDPDTRGPITIITASVIKRVETHADP